MKLRVEHREPPTPPEGADAPESGWLLWDADCGFCRRWVERLHRGLERNGFQIAPLQEQWVRDYFDDLSEKELLSAFRVLRRDGAHVYGGDALMYISRYTWWLRPLWWMRHVPPLRGVLRAVYRWVARHRNFLGRFM